MWQSWYNWLEERFGYQRLKEFLTSGVTSRSHRWRYVWASGLTFVFAIQVLTGILLMFAYSPGSASAWGSVYFVQYELPFGWLVRGLHHFAAEAMIVLMAAYLLHLGLTGMHLPPGEAVWWTALLLFAATMATDLTGNPLPWDQKAYWALQVELNIIGGIPGLGPLLQSWILGGTEAGQLTLTRLYALHVVVLPVVLAFLLLSHHLALRRYLQQEEKMDSENGTRSHGRWRPQVARVVLLVILASLCLIPQAMPLNSHHDRPAGQEPASDTAETRAWLRWAYLGRSGCGAALEAPADPNVDYPIARPKWTYWFLFQLRKSLEGPWASWATVFGPVVVLLVLFVLPLAGRGRARWWIHCVSVVLLLVLATAIAGLTAWAWWNDYGPSASAEKFQEELHKQRDRAQRAIQLAARGIPVEGPAELLRRDPRTRGRELYQTHCATCHGFGTLIPVKNAVAPDLHNFGTQDWIYQLLQRMRDETSVESQVMPQMASWLRREYERAARADARAQKAGEPPQATARLEEDLKRIAAWLAAHPRRAVPQEGPQRQAFEQDTSAFARGYLAYETHCLRCHVYSGIGGGDTNGPDLTGYGDADWLRGLLHAPYSRQYYGPSVVRWSRLANPRSWMPAFRDTENANAQLWQRDWERTWNELEQMVPENDEKREQRLQAMRRVCTTLHLSELDRELIIRFVLNDDRLVFGGPAVLP